VEACIARGLTYATSENGKAKLRSRLEEDARALVGGAGGAGAGASRVASSVQVVRLEDEEAAFRALPLVRCVSAFLHFRISAFLHFCISCSPHL
jgi:hypothetical protein